VRFQWSRCGGARPLPRVVRASLDELHARASKRNAALGMMVEVPAAALTIETSTPTSFRSQQRSHQYVAARSRDERTLLISVFARGVRLIWACGELCDACGAKRACAAILQRSRASPALLDQGLRAFSVHPERSACEGRDRPLFRSGRMSTQATRRVQDLSRLTRRSSDVLDRAVRIASV